MTPTTRSEFFFGKQLPYIALGMNFFRSAACWCSCLAYRIKAVSDAHPAALLYIIIATGMGLLISTFMKAQLPPFSERRLSR
ncbi:hypothetical protein ACVXHA_02360 [Escherichia coli]